MICRSRPLAGFFLQLQKGLRYKRHFCSARQANREAKRAIVYKEVTLNLMPFGTGHVFYRTDVSSSRRYAVELGLLERHADVYRLSGMGTAIHWVETYLQEGLRRFAASV